MKHGGCLRRAGGVTALTGGRLRVVAIGPNDCAAEIQGMLIVYSVCARAIPCQPEMHGPELRRSGQEKDCGGFRVGMKRVPVAFKGSFEG